jgi:hypothetical protein
MISSDTGRFYIKFQVQQRILRHEHEDGKFGYYQYKLVKSFVIKYRDHCIFMCLDDKAIIPVGNPGIAVSTGVRGKTASLVPLESSTGILTALDHDWHNSGLVPSVGLIVEIPESESDSFFRRNIHVTTKDKVFQPSSPFRHAAENLNIVQEPTHPIMVQYTDGGPDHRCTYASVQLAVLATFISLDLDMFVLARTAPNASWVNPAERCNSLLNLALHIVGNKKCKKTKSTYHSYFVLVM